MDEEWVKRGHSLAVLSAVLSIYSSALTLTDIVGHGIGGVWSRAGFKGGQTGQLPRASTTRGPP